MKRTVSSVSKRLALAGALAALATVLSYLEAISGINSLMLPGTKIGLGNIAVILTAYTVSLTAASVVSVVRVAVMSLLFGSSTTFMFSLFGALASYISIAFSKLVLQKRVSLIGVSVLSSASHMVGQLAAAALTLSDTSVFRLLPLYLVTAVVTGTLTGIVSQLCAYRLNYVAVKRQKER